MPKDFSLLSNKKGYLVQINNALKAGNNEAILALLKQNISIKEVVQTFDNSPIISLLENDKIINKAAILEMLLKKGASTNIKDKNHRNILLYLIYNINHIKAENLEQNKIKELYEFVKIILSHNQSIQHECDDSNMNAIAKAVEFGDSNLTELLLDNGANPNSKLWGENDHSLIKEAIAQKNLPIIKLLLKKAGIHIRLEDAINIFNLSQNDSTLLSEFKKRYFLTEKETRLELLYKAAGNNQPELLTPLSEKGLKNFDSTTLEDLLKEYEEVVDHQTLNHIRCFVQNYKPVGVYLIELIHKKQNTEAINLINTGAWLNVRVKTDTALAVAAKTGQIEIVEALLKAGADIDMESGASNFTALEYALSEGYESIASILVDYNAKIDLARNNQSPPLICAIEKGYIESALKMIKAGANTEVRHPQYHNTPLMFAAQQGQIEVVEALLTAGAEVNATTVQGSTALTFALEAGHTTVIAKLIEYGANLHTKYPLSVSRGRCYPLIYAIAKGYIEAALKMIKAGANTDVRHKYPHGTPLRFAATEGQTEVVEALLAAGAEINDTTPNGSTALMFALANGHTTAAAKLIDHGANFHTNPINSILKGVYPLIYAIEKGYIEAALKMIKAGADTEIKHLQYHNTPLMFAAQQGQIEVVKALLAAGAEINATTPTGSTALMFALANGHPTVVAKLIDHGAKVNLPGNSPNSILRNVPPLLYALQKNYTDLAFKMIEAGAEINAKDPRCGITPLIYAARHGNAEIVKELLNRGANPNLCDLHRNTALSTTKDNHIRAMLLKKTKNSIQQILDKKIDSRINKAFEQILIGEDFEKAFIDHKLYKYIAPKEEHERLFQEKAHSVVNNHIKLTFQDTIKSIFIGRKRVIQERALNDIKTTLYHSDDYKLLHEAIIEHKLSKPLSNKGRSL